MSITLRFTHTVDGSLTDVTTAVLSDPTGTYGVKRNDNDTTVVADGTALVKQSTGIYEYTFTEPVAGLEYTYYVETVYGENTYRYEFGYDDTSSTRPVTVAEAKDHMNVTISDDDTLIGNMIDAAAKWCEMYMGRRFITTTEIEYYDSFPSEISPVWSPLDSVTSIQYEDSYGATQTLSSSLYQVDTASEPARIKPAYNESWPSTRAEYNAITLTYTAGYGTSTSDIPDIIRNAVLLLVGHLYENREDTSPLEMKKIPMGVKALLGIDRVRFP